MKRTRSTELSRRVLLLRAGHAAGAVTILGTGIHAATAAKISQTAASYQTSPKGAESCANCAQFQPPNACSTVDGSISPDGWCSHYLKKA
jgi:hypothetical protein